MFSFFPILVKLAFCTKMQIEELSKTDAQGGPFSTTLWPPSYHESCLNFFALALRNSECLRAGHELRGFPILFQMVSIFIPLSGIDDNGLRLLENTAPFSSCWHLLLGRRLCLRRHWEPLLGYKEGR